MRKIFVSATIVFFFGQAAYSSSILAVDPVPPADGYQAAKDSAACKQDWTTNSKGKASILFEDTKVYKRSFKRMEYIEACIRGKLPARSIMK